VDLVACGRGAEPVGDGPYHSVDLTNPDAIGDLVRDVGPDWVIHTAALTNVDQNETEPDLARQVNVEPVQSLVRACQGADAGLAFLSTDYVFDGRAGPYGEDDPPNPLSHYGKLKLEGERLVLEGGIPGLVVRTLWLYGHVSGTRRNLVTWPLESLARGEKLRLVDDQWGNPTYAPDLAAALIDLCARRATGLYHFGGTTFLTRYELVLELAHHFGLDASGVESMSTAQADQAAPRPLRSGLRCAAVAEELGREPLSLSQGVERLRQQPDFGRDFPELI
jgi:dTDP-4-dehydrorhamnose reductase